MYWPSNHFVRQRQLTTFGVSFFFVFVRLFSFKTQINVYENEKYLKKKKHKLTYENTICLILLFTTMFVILKVICKMENFGKTNFKVIHIQGHTEEKNQANNSPKLF
jgi:hypothetical protein